MEPDYQAAQRRRSLRSQYGITEEEYNRCMATSDCCEYCNSTTNLCYDHDHYTMEFRGVLCVSCNGAFGKFGDSIEGLERAINYLRREEYEEE